ncbi:MAG: hypothetical protein ABL903_20565 [Methylococcales bacterium]
MKNNKFVVFLFAIGLASCANTNEGKIDFRRTNNTQVDIPNIPQKNKVTLDTQQSKDITEITQNTEDKKCDFKYQLIAKNASLGTNSIFDKGDSLSVHLRSAFIADFAEFPPLSITNFNR